MTEQAVERGSCYLMELKAAAEAQMRRSAPQLDDTGHSSKKRRTSEPGDSTAEHAEGPVSRYSYASQDALVNGCTAFLGSCGFRRERSSTKEVLDVLRKVLPEGTKLQLVKVGCNGLVVIAAEPPNNQQLSPTAVVQEVLQRMESGDLPRTKFCQRIMPAETTCALTATALKQALTSVVSSYVAQQLITNKNSEGEQPKQPVEFAVAFKNRDNVTVGCKAEGQPQQPPQQQQQLIQTPRQQQQLASSGTLQAVPAAELVDRAKAIELAAAVMQDCCRDIGGARVNLVDPQVVLLLEVVPLARHQLACAVAALPGSMVLTKPKLVVKPTAAGGK